MDRVSYVGESLLTGTAIAQALLDYAQALAEVGSSGTVEIPVLDANGNAASARLLVGPASQLVITTIDTALAEIEDAELVAHLESITKELRAIGGPAQHPHVEAVPPSAHSIEFGI